MYKIFLSSTSRDLATYREAVHRAIDRLDGFMLVRMEDFGARDETPHDLCARLVGESHVLVGLLGHYYGSRPPNEEHSFTELEYLAAADGGLPRLMFFAPDNLPIAASLREPDESFERQQSFRARVMAERVGASFDSPEHLANAVTNALANWREKHELASAQIAAEEHAEAQRMAKPVSSAVAVAKLREQLLHFWISQILASQHQDTGGIRTLFHDPSSPPQVWATAQSLVGILRALIAFDYRNQIDDSLTGFCNRIRRAFDFIEQARLADSAGGGWSYSLGAQGEAVTEVACWVALARLYGLRTGFLWLEQEVPPMVGLIQRDLFWIIERQHESGGWCPVRHLSRKNTRTYSTLMALWALLEASRSDRAASASVIEAAIYNGLSWLLNERTEKFGWTPNPERRRQRDDCLGLEAQALAILMLGRQESNSSVERLLRDPVVEKAKIRFLQHPDLRQRRILLNDTLPDSDQWLESTDFLLEGSSFLWGPWTVLSLNHLTRDKTLPNGSDAEARKLQVAIMGKLFDARDELGAHGTYELAEVLFCLASVFWEER